MKKCKSCQSEIDIKATKCPHCQTDQRGWFMKHPILTVILVIFAVGMVSSASGSKSTSTSNTDKPSTNTTGTVTPTSENTADKQKATESNIPAEYKSALAQAKSYSTTLHMSKRGVYDQLVSEYGGKFTAVAAQYAIDNLEADWKANALSSAKTYQDTMNLSPKAIRDQLVSSYGGKFTKEEADYALEHLND